MTAREMKKMVKSIKNEAKEIISGKDRSSEMKIFFVSNLQNVSWPLDVLGLKRGSELNGRVFRSMRAKKWLFEYQRKLTCEFQRSECF